ncbi:hypothetical protein B5X24_HaOG204602 [Helicoverpa armigera]|nr:hypothetical protein B5X24_HaOG204602 [Helicoverpa armigera]
MMALQRGRTGTKKLLAIYMDNLWVQTNLLSSTFHTKSLPLTPQPNLACYRENVPRLQRCSRIKGAAGVLNRCSYLNCTPLNHMCLVLLQFTANAIDYVCSVVLVVRFRVDGYICWCAMFYSFTRVMVDFQRKTQKEFGCARRIFR